MKEAQVDLARVRELVASSSASVQSAPQSAPAESPGSDQLNGVRDVLSQLAASGFRIVPGQEGLATALDQLWGLGGPPPDVTMSPLLDMVDVEDEEEDDDTDPMDEQVHAALQALTKTDRRRLCRKTNTRSRVGTVKPHLKPKPEAMHSNC